MTTVVVGNFPHYLDHAEAVEELSLALCLGQWVLACELDAGNDVALDVAIARTGRKVRPYHRDKRTQVVAPAARKTAGRYRELTPGKRGINPPRGMSIVDDLGTRTRYVSMHLPNGKRNPAKRGRSFRQWAWNRYERRAQAKVARWLADGWNVVAGGDVNDRRGISLHPSQVVVKHYGLMWLLAIPAPGHAVVTTGARSIEGDHLDHRLLRARIEFVPIVKETP